jgi:hypothetical protein
VPATPTPPSHPRWSLCSTTDFPIVLFCFLFSCKGADGASEGAESDYFDLRRIHSSTESGCDRE